MSATSMTASRPADAGRPKQLIGARLQEWLMRLPACVIVAFFMQLPIKQ